MARNSKGYHNKLMKPPKGVRNLVSTRQALFQTCWFKPSPFLQNPEDWGATRGVGFIGLFGLQA